MASKVRAGRRDWDRGPASGEREPDADPELDAEAAAVAAWFDALPAALRAALDREARTGAEAYRWP